MTTFVRTQSDLSALDRHIGRALGALRAARAASARVCSHKNFQAEARAEADLNALLEYRHAAQQLSADPHASRPPAP